MEDSQRRQIRACIDRTVAPKPSGERMALVRASQWQPGDVIRAAFVDGEPSLQESVRNIALTWLNYADLHLYFVNSFHDVDIRISFKQVGSWSYIGTDCRTVPTNEPTMNYGWLTSESSDDEVSRVVLHEFGHALGCIHEHQSPAGGIKWNEDMVYAYYSGPPNFWSKEEIKRNLLETYDQDLTIHTQLDPASIMMYPIDRRFTLDGFETGLNSKLSSMDKEFIRQIYP